MAEIDPDFTKKSLEPKNLRSKSRMRNNVTDLRKSDSIRSEFVS